MKNLIFKQEDSIGYITINREKALNALNHETLIELDQVITRIASEKTVRALILTGSGTKAFVAGADIKEIHALDSKTAADFSKLGQEVFTKIEHLYCPVIAAVNGFALGGGLELALSCDIIYASESAQFGLPECTLGLIPGFGGTIRLARKISKNRALEMTLSGGMLDASTAETVGLVNKTFKAEELLPACLKLAATFCKRSPQALDAIKKSINESYGVTSRNAMDIENQYFAGLFGSQNQKEGTAAFMEKRKPSFTGFNN